MKSTRLAFTLATALVSGSMAGCFYSHKVVREEPTPAVTAPPESSSSTTTTTTRSDDGTVEKQKSTTYSTNP
jgi:hypothetical protein